MLLPAAARALEAYGGENLWRKARFVEATVSASGWAFRLKRVPAVRDNLFRLDATRPRASQSPVTSASERMILEGHSVRIETRSGEILSRRPDASKGFPYGRRLFRWDRLDQAYFSLYAVWNYLLHPALLLREDITWTQPEKNRLDAVFPSGLPTHCARQSFHYDPATGLLQRHDYTAEVFGGWARSANVVLEHDAWKDVPYPSRRRVTPRLGKNRVLPAPVLIDLRIRDWRILPAPG